MTCLLSTEESFFKYIADDLIILLFSPVIYIGDALKEDWF